MGMDIYFQAFDAQDARLGETQNLRGREVYHLINRWCESRQVPSPANGQHISLSEHDWRALRPSLRVVLIEAVAEVEVSMAKSPYKKEVNVDRIMHDAKAAADDWMRRIWPDGAHRVEYWFTN